RVLTGQRLDFRHGRDRFSALPERAGGEARQQQLRLGIRRDSHTPLEAVALDRPLGGEAAIEGIVVGLDMTGSALGVEPGLNHELLEAPGLGMTDAAQALDEPASDIEI